MGKDPKKKVDENTLHFKNITEIVTALIQAYDKREKINLHTLIQENTRRNRTPKAPKLVDIISALP